VRKILIVEDDKSIAKVLVAYLTAAGYAPTVIDDGLQALPTFRSLRPSLVLLDVVLPGKDGWTILREIRAESSCPVIMLTALNELDERLDGLNNGADDYIGKPFPGAEVVARVQAVLRRAPMITSDENVAHGSLVFDFRARQVRYGGQPVSLTPRDLSLLLFLAKHPNQTLTRETLIEKVWGVDYVGSDRAVDLSIKRIRQTLTSLEPPAEEAPQIVTMRGLGYRFDVNATP